MAGTRAQRAKLSDHRAACGAHQSAAVDASLFAGVEGENWRGEAAELACPSKEASSNWPAVSRWREGRDGAAGGPPASSQIRSSRCIAGSPTAGF